MSVRVDSSSLIAGSVVVGNRGLGVLGSVIRSTTATGTHGPGLLYNDWDPGDDAKEFMAFIVTPPASGNLFVDEPGAFSLTDAPDGAYSLVYKLVVDGVDQGTATASINIGTGGAVASGDVPGVTLTPIGGFASATAEALAFGDIPQIWIEAPGYLSDRNGSASGSISNAYIMPMVGSGTGNATAGGSTQGLRKTRYTPGQVPQDPAELPRFLQAEFERLTDALESPFTHQLLEKLNTEPSRKRDGYVAYADGTNWNPGAGQGVYVYYAGIWNKLG
jgi:hypothetical protein